VYLRLQITPLYLLSLVLFVLSLWYNLVIVLTVPRIFTASDYSFGMLGSLYCPYFVCLRLLITPLVSFGHCIVRTSCIYSFWLPFGICWSLYWSYVVYVRLLITPLVSGGHCIVRTSSIYSFWLPLWYLLVIVLSVLRLFKASDYSFGILGSLYCLYFLFLASDYSLSPLGSLYCMHFVYLRLLITPLYLLVIVLSVLRLYTASDYSFASFDNFIVRTSSI